jgi:hypothetical protein
VKNLYILTIVNCLVFFALHQAKAQTTLETQLRNFAITKYLNKPIDTLLTNLPLGYDTSFIVGSNGNINRAASLQINYPPNCQFWIDIFITTPQFVKPYKNTKIRSEIAWPLSLLRKEKVGSVTIYSGAYEIINEADIY